MNRIHFSFSAQAQTMIDPLSQFIYTLNGLLANEPSVIAQILRSLTNDPFIDQLT